MWSKQTSAERMGRTSTWAHHPPAEANLRLRTGRRKAEPEYLYLLCDKI
jgi:hypothetical protein